MIFPADISDAKQLSEISFLSKGYWNYTKNQLESWREELTVYPSYLENENGFVYKIDQKIIGFYILQTQNITTISLEFLFVLPQYIAKGIGKELLKHAIKKSKERKAFVLTVLSDPNAEKFYLKNGFVTISKEESSIKDRFLPLMEMYL